MLTSPVSASSISENSNTFDYESVINTYYSSIPEEVKSNFGSVKQEKTHEYLTNEEVSKTTPEILSEIYNEFIDNPAFEGYSDTDEKANKYVANLIKEAVSKAENEVELNYRVPGYDNLTEDEKDLAKSHPIEFVKYAEAALQATDEAERYYADHQLYQGNGDAFRHAYWNALIVKKFNGLREDRVKRAQIWTDAHEQYSSGNDKLMDLINNEIGRYHAYLNLSDNYPTLSRDLRAQVAQGGMVRIGKNGELFPTSKYTGR